MITPVQTCLANKLIELNKSLSPLESFNMNLLMSVAIGGIAPRGGIPTEGVRAEAWEAGLLVLGDMHPRGLRFVGKVPFMTEELLVELQEKLTGKRGFLTEQDLTSFLLGKRVLCA